MFKELLALLSALLLSLAVLVLPLGIKLYDLSKENSYLESDNIDLFQRVTVKNEKVNEYESMLDHLRNENFQLSKKIEELAKQKPKAKYAAQSIGTLKALTPEETYTVIPDAYTHYLLGYIPIASFKKTNNEYVFKTEDLSFRSTLILDDEETSAIIEIASSADGIWHEVPTETKTIKLAKTYPRLDLDIGIGAGINTSYYTPQPVINVSLIQLSESLDILPLGLTLGPEPNVSLSPISYNIGKPLPMIDNLWISGGMFSSTSIKDYKLGAILTVSAKL